MGVIAGLALLSPVVVPPVARLVSSALRRGRGAVGMLVRENARTAVRRTAATATPVLVTVGCAVLITGMVQTTAAGFAAVRATTIRADAVIVPDGTPGLTDAAGGESSLFSASSSRTATLSARSAPPRNSWREPVRPPARSTPLRHDDRILGGRLAGRGPRPETGRDDAGVLRRRHLGTTDRRRHRQGRRRRRADLPGPAPRDTTRRSSPRRPSSSARPPIPGGGSRGATSRPIRPRPTPRRTGSYGSRPCSSWWSPPPTRAWRS